MSFVPLVCAEFLCFCLKSFLDDLVCVDLLPFAIRIQCSWWVWESWWLCLILVCRLLSLVAMVRLLGFRSLWINSWWVHWCWSHNCLVIWVAFGSSWLTGRLIIYLCTVVYFILFLFFYDGFHRSYTTQFSIISWYAFHPFHLSKWKQLCPMGQSRWGFLHGWKKFNYLIDDPSTCTDSKYLD